AGPSPRYMEQRIAQLERGLGYGPGAKQVQTSTSLDQSCLGLWVSMQRSITTSRDVDYTVFRHSALLRWLQKQRAQSGIACVDLFWLSEKNAAAQSAYH